MTTYKLVMPEDMNHYGKDITFVRVDEAGNKIPVGEATKGESK